MAQQVAKSSLSRPTDQPCSKAPPTPTGDCVTHLNKLKSIGVRGLNSLMTPVLEKLSAVNCYSWHWLWIALNDLEFVLYFFWLEPYRTLRVLPKLVVFPSTRARLGKQVLALGRGI